MNTDGTWHDIGVPLQHSSSSNVKWPASGPAACNSLQHTCWDTKGHQVIHDATVTKCVVSLLVTSAVLCI